LLKADVFRRTGEVGSALEAVRRALALRGPDMDFQLIFKARNYMADIHFQRAKYGEAMEILKESEALILRKRRGEIPEKVSNELITDITRQKGKIYLYMNKYEEAERNLFRALEMDRKKEDDYCLSFTYALIGVLFARKNRYSQAIGYLQEAVQIRKRYEDLSGIASIYNTLGLLYLKLYRRKDAIESFRESLWIKGFSGEIGTLPPIYLNLTIAHVDEGEYSRARECAKKALTYSRKLSLDRYVIQSINNLGIVEFYLENWKDAERNYRTSLEYAESISNSYEKALTLYSLARYHLANDNPEMAGQNASDALSCFEKLGAKYDQVRTLMLIEGISE
jgi:tetratricopeptide (TPR) repeat protein